MELLYEGKAKKLYTTDDPEVLRMEFKVVSGMLERSRISPTASM